MFLSFFRVLRTPPVPGGRSRLPRASVSAGHAGGGGLRRGAYRLGVQAETWGWALGQPMGPRWGVQSVDRASKTWGRAPVGSVRLAVPGRHAGIRISTRWRVVKFGHFEYCGHFDSLTGYIHRIVTCKAGSASVNASVRKRASAYACARTVECVVRVCNQPEHTQREGGRACRQQTGAAGRTAASDAPGWTGG